MFYCGAARLATTAATCALPVVPRCSAARLAAAACTLPAVLPSGGCMSCRAVVLPASPQVPPPARRLSCCPPRRRCLHAACRVAIGRLCVVPRCGAAHLAAAACVLPAVLLSGGCASCCAVVLPASPPLPAHCLLLHRWVVGC